MLAIWSAPSTSRTTPSKIMTAVGTARLLALVADSQNQELAQEPGSWHKNQGVGTVGMWKFATDPFPDDSSRYGSFYTSWGVLFWCPCVRASIIWGSFGAPDFWKLSYLGPGTVLFQVPDFRLGSLGVLKRCVLAGVGGSST